MGRLSNDTRQRMARKLVLYRFDERAQQLIATTRSLFVDLYEQHYDADVRKHMAAITKKVKNAFLCDNELDANVSGRRLRVGLIPIGHGMTRWDYQVGAKPMLRDTNRYEGTVSVDQNSDLGKRLVAFAEACESLKGEIDPAYREALGALSQFTTGKRLAEEWPEAMPIIGALIPEDDRTLPVVQVTHLNAKFKLPPKDKPIAKAA